MVEEVVITGLGVVSPIGVGCDAMSTALAEKRGGVQDVPRMMNSEWVAPFGGYVDGFEGKAHVKPRKSLKVMAREIQFAFAAGEQATEHAGIGEESSGVNPERMGICCGAGLLYCDPEELAAAYAACIDDGKFVRDRWGTAGIRELFPLWMLKYLPNMAACHVGIRREAQGPTNTIAHGDASSLLALGESLSTIQRGHADLMLTGGSSSRLHMLDPFWREGAAQVKAGVAPADACRPFEASRLGAVCGEGAAMMVLESRSHAERRKAKPLATVLSVASRSEASLNGTPFTGKSIANAIDAALEQASLTAADVDHVNAHAMGSVTVDKIEAEVLRDKLGNTPVTAPKSYFGNVGAAGGAVELAASLVAAQAGHVPATLNYDHPDPACPVEVVTDLKPLDSGAVMLSLNYNLSGQASVALLRFE